MSRGMTPLRTLRSAVRDALARLADLVELVVPALGGHRPTPVPVRVRQPEGRRRR